MSSILTKSKIVLSGITTMITRAPYTNGQYYRVRKIDVTTVDGAAISGQLIKFWDQDLSSTTTVSVGSASSALLIIGGGVATGAVSGFTATTLSRPMDTLPRIPFYTGITTVAPAGATINLELEVV